MRMIRWIPLLSVLLLAGCELIGDIFQGGMVIGILLVLIILALVAWALGKFRGRGQV